MAAARSRRLFEVAHGAAFSPGKLPSWARALAGASAGLGKHAATNFTQAQQVGPGAGIKPGRQPVQ